MPRSRALAFLALALAVLGLFLGAFAGCLPTYTFGADTLSDAGGDATSAVDATSGEGGSAPDATANDAPSDSTSPLDAAADGPRDSSPDVLSQNDGSLTPSVVASGASKQFSTGFGYQLHLVLAQNDGRYWFFYVDDTAGVIKTVTSPDLVTWTAGASVPLAIGYTLADGNDFSVAYANLSGTDAIHIVANCVASSRYTAFHIRATIGGGNIVPSQPVPLPDTDSNTPAGSSGGSCPQAGPATIVASDGHVYDVTAWTGHPSTTCDTNIYLSPGVDTGTTWNGGSFVHDGYFISIPTFAYSHDLVDLPEAGVVLAVWPDEDNTAQTLFDSIGWGLSPSFDGGGIGSTGALPDAAAELFAGAGGNASYDDWSMCRLTDTSVHVLRHVTAAAGNSVSVFQEVVYGGSTWQATAAPPPPVTGLSNTGVVLLSDANPGDGMLAITIGTNNALNVAKWKPGGSWLQLTTIPGAVQRQSLGGSGCGNAHPVVFWTEGASAPFTVMRADLSSLLGP